MLEIYMDQAKRAGNTFLMCCFLEMACDTEHGILEAIEIPKDEAIRAHYVAAVAHFFEKGKQIFKPNYSNDALVCADFCIALILKIGDEAQFSLINTMAQAYYEMGAPSYTYSDDHLLHAAKLAEYTHNHDLLAQISESCKAMGKAAEGFYGAANLLLLAAQTSHDPNVKADCLRTILGRCPNPLHSADHTKRIAHLIVEVYGNGTVPYPANMGDDLRQKFNEQKEIILKRKAEVVASVNPPLPPEIAAIAAGYTD